VELCSVAEEDEKFEALVNGVSGGKKRTVRNPGHSREKKSLPMYNNPRAKWLRPETEKTEGGGGDFKTQTISARCSCISSGQGENLPGGPPSRK